jgi:hypothetical protein
MKKILFCTCSALLFLACNSDKAKDEPAAATTEVEAAPAKQLPTEIGDDKFVTLGQTGLNNLSSGNIDAWMESRIQASRSKRTSSKSKRTSKLSEIEFQ